MYHQLLLSLFFILSFFASRVSSQQNYSGNAVLDCDGNDRKGPSSTVLYTCNGQKRVCQAFLIFRSQPPYNSVPTISTLLSSNQEELASINSVTRLTVFPMNKKVIVPVNCSCSGKYYQAIAAFPIPDANQTYLAVANDTYQGLSSCDSLKGVNPYGEFELDKGELRVPLRCACPTSSQTSDGFRYLLTYSVSWTDTLKSIGESFNVTSDVMLKANGFSEANPTIFPFTTILVPLVTEPSSSQTQNQQLPYSPPPTNISTVLPQPTHIRAKNDVNKPIYLGVGISTGCLLLIILLGFMWSLWHKNRKEKVPPSQREGKGKLISPADLRGEIAILEEILKVFKYEVLRKATQNFSPRNRIQGSVYRGTFGQEILAVKRVSRDVSKEVSILKKTNHFNLIQLQGYCEFNGCFYLVFEYMSNGSLRGWLSNKSAMKTRSWSQRMRIALDVANGLHYLHNFTKPAYVHKDINSSNILLNDDLRAKIANFGLAQVVKRQTLSTYFNAQHGGARAYLPPEYIEVGIVTPKTDVYAFGVILLEVVTGKDAAIVHSGKETLLATAIASVMEREDAETELHQSFIDPRLERSGRELAVRMVKLSLTCLVQEPERRPSMEEIVSTLLKFLADLKSPEIDSPNSPPDKKK